MSDLISRADAIKGIQDGYCSCVSDCIDEINKLQSIGTDCTDFIHWISKVVADEELWELNAVGYGEIICRKLVKIGALATTEKPPYYYVPSVSAERVGEWIPCREKMPKELERVNITWLNHNPPFYYQHIKDIPQTDTAVYYRGKWYWWDVAVIDILAEYGEDRNAEQIDKDIEVVAWMPLPKPYKGGDSE